MTTAPAPGATGSGLVPHLARFGRALRERGVGVGLSDEADGLEALSLVDLGDRDEVRRTLRAAMKIRPRDVAAFEELFARWWSKRPPREAAETPRPEQPRFEDPTRPPRPGPQLRPGPRLAGPESDRGACLHRCQDGRIGGHTRCFGRDQANCCP